MANEKIIWDYLKSQGMTNQGAAGLMGNLFAESSLIPSNVQNSANKKLGLTDAQYTLKVDDGSYLNFVKDGYGYGLAQWTYYSRKQNLLNYAKQTNRSIGDLQMQLEFLVNELKQSFPKVWNILCSSHNLQQTSNSVLLDFERPAKKDELSVQMARRNYGQKYLDLYMGSDPVESKEVKTTFSSVMKYTDTNPPIVCMQKNSTCYKGTSKMTPKGILWHSTGANNPWLKRYVQPHKNYDTDYDAMINLLGKNIYANDWNHIDRQAGLNAWIGKLADGRIASVQSMPWNYKPWGCGSGSKGSCNNGWIQFEICEDALTDPAYAEAAFEEACQLTAYLCKKYNINPKGTVKFNGVTVPTILCHWDSYKLKLGSGHNDIYNWFPKVINKDMDDVRNRVAEILKEEKQEEEEMTQEKFNELMNNYLAELAKEPADDWSLEARQYCESKGLIQGDQNGNKMYRKFLNRQEIATILYRLAQMGVIK